MFRVNDGQGKQLVIMNVVAVLTALTVPGNDTNNLES